MGIQKESQALRRNSEKASKVSSFSALGAVNGFSWAEGSLWNSTANLRNQCVSTSTTSCGTWRLEASSYRNAWAQDPGKVSLPADLEKIQGASLEEGLVLGYISGFMLPTPSLIIYDSSTLQQVLPWTYHPVCCFTTLCLYICCSFNLEYLPGICDNSEFHVYTQNGLFPKRLWAPCGANLTHLSTSTF